MRFYRPKEGSTRVKTKFAILPITIGAETRWLERVSVRQVYRDYRDFSGWDSYEFVDSGSYFDKR